MNYTYRDVALLIEASRIVDKIVSMENDAKEKYELAIKELNAYDDAVKKKSQLNSILNPSKETLDSWAQKTGQQIGKKKQTAPVNYATLRLKYLKDYAFTNGIDTPSNKVQDIENEIKKRVYCAGVSLFDCDSKIEEIESYARKSRKSFEQNVQDAKEKYNKYNPDVTDLDFALADIEREEKDVTPKYEFDEIRYPIDNFYGGKWWNWPNDVKDSGIQFGSSESGESEKSVGPGENWLAYMFGASVMGKGASYDLSTQDGRRWEVKMIDSSKKIVTGKHGRKAAARIRESLVDPFTNDMFKELKQSINDESFAAMLDSKMVRNLRIIVNYADTLVEVQEFKLNHLVTYRKVLYACKELSKVSALNGYFNHVAFANPDDYIEEMCMISPRKVFPGIDGMFIVTKDAFFRIDNEDFDNMIHYDSISFGTVKFTVDFP